MLQSVRLNLISIPVKSIIIKKTKLVAAQIEESLNNQYSDVLYDARYMAPKAPKAAPRVGVAYPESIEPRTAIINNMNDCRVASVTDYKQARNVLKKHADAMNKKWEKARREEIKNQKI